MNHTTDSFPRHTLSANCSTLLAELPLPARLDRVQAQRIPAVEFWWPFATAAPPDRDVERFTSAVYDSGLRLDALNFTGGDMQRGEKGLLSIPGREQEFRDSVDIAVTIGAALGTRVFNALYGNRIPGIPAGSQKMTALTNLQYAAHAAHRIGAAVLLEPLSAAPGYPLRRLDDAGVVIDAMHRCIPSGSVGLLADVYHLATNGSDTAEQITRHADRIAHMQIADSPGRGAPGTGRLDLAALVEHARRAGYQGPISLEYFCDEADTFTWLER